MNITKVFKRIRERLLNPGDSFYITLEAMFWYTVEVRLIIHALTTNQDNVGEYSTKY